MGKLRTRLPSHSTVAAYVALFVAVGGTSAYAIDEWTGANIQDGTLSTADYKNNDIRSADVRDDVSPGGGLTGADIDELTLGEVPSATKLRSNTPDDLKVDTGKQSQDPEPDPLLTASGGVPISRTVNFAAAFSPVAIASLEIYSSTGAGQAECALWADGQKFSQSGVADFAFANDNEHLTLVGQHGFAIDGVGSGFASGFDIPIEVRCSVTSAGVSTVRFERGDLIVIGVPL